MGNNSLSRIYYIEQKVMASYLNILPHVSKWEGGLVYFPEEGQYTNRGIQWTTFKKLAPQLIGLQDPTIEDLKNLTEDQWRKFVEYFWNKATYNNSITRQDAANLAFHAYWGSGIYGIKEIQKAVGVTADGIIGPQTVAAINKDPKAAEKMHTALDNYYRRLAANKPDRYGRFLKGWLNRLAELKPSFFFGAGIILVAAAAVYLILKNK